MVVNERGKKVKEKKVIVTVKNIYEKLLYQKAIKTKLNELELQKEIDNIIDNFEEGYNWQDDDVWEELEEKGLIKQISSGIDADYEVIL